MSVPRFNPTVAGQATLTPVTFEAIHTNLSLLTAGGTIARVEDLSDKILYGHPRRKVGYLWDSTHTAPDQATENLVAVALNDVGIEFAAKTAVEERLDEEFPGYPIGYVEFSRDTNDARLNGRITALDNGSIHVGGEWSLSPDAQHLRSLLVGFAGRIGLDHYLFGKRKKLEEGKAVTTFRSFLKEETGQHVAAALLHLSEVKT